MRAPNFSQQYMMSILKKIVLGMMFIFFLFLTIGTMTTFEPLKRVSSTLFANQINTIDDDVFLQLFNIENNSFSLFTKLKEADHDLKGSLFNRMTNMSLSDLSSFIRIEISSYAVHHKKQLLANDQLDETPRIIDESGPPLESIMEKREAVDLSDEEKKESDKGKQERTEMTTGDRKVIFLYNTHNRESFLPHLPGEENPDNAHHEEVNITKVSERLAEKLADYGIGAEVDKTDIMSILNKKGWSYGQSYNASREVVEEAITNNQDIQYIFDIHRDSISRNLSTKKIAGKKYAKVLFVIGKENKNYKKNLSLAKQLHDSLNSRLPNISRGVITKEGSNVNGVYNQDLNENSILIEVGGHENTLEEMYGTADVIAEVFSELYWDAEKVNK